MPLINQLNMHTHGAEFFCRAVYPHFVWVEDRLAIIPQHDEFHIDKQNSDYWNEFFGDESNWVEVDWKELRVVSFLDVERRDYRGNDYLSRKLFQLDYDDLKVEVGLIGQRLQGLQRTSHSSDSHSWDGKRKKVIEVLESIGDELSERLFDSLKRVIRTRYALRESVAAGKTKPESVAASKTEPKPVAAGETEPDDIGALNLLGSPRETVKTDESGKWKNVGRILATVLEKKEWYHTVLCIGSEIYPIAIELEGSKMKIGVNPYSRVERNRREIIETLLHLLDVMIDCALGDQGYFEHMLPK